MEFKQKLIFLDIDGVMNNKIDKTSYYSFNPSTYGISRKNLKNLEYLLALTGAKIVMSSSWAHLPPDHIFAYNGQRFKSPLNDFLKLIPNKLYWFNNGLCPHLPRCNKKSDILGYFYALENSNENLKMKNFKFVVIDDLGNQDLDFFGYDFYRTNIETGLTKSDAEAIAINLNEDK